MSAKPAKKKSQPAPTPTPPGALPTGTAAAPAAEPATSWLDSADPRKRRYGQIALILVWLYVAALWLLALDQLFGWGLFGARASIK